jgi:arginine utilization protein RocB
MKVDIYFNLHRKVFSIRHKGRVIAHASYVIVRNPRFVVGQAGNSRVRSEKRKNVHAYVRGELATSEPEDIDGGYWDTFKVVTYNPYKHKTFVNADDVSESIHSADWVEMRVNDKKPEMCACWLDNRINSDIMYVV